MASIFALKCRDGKDLMGMDSRGRGYVNNSMRVFRDLLAKTISTADAVLMLAQTAAQHLLGVEAGVLPGSAANLVVGVNLREKYIH